jgi:hypothetical protein
MIESTKKWGQVLDFDISKKLGCRVSTFEESSSSDRVEIPIKDFMEGEEDRVIGRLQE